MKAIFEQWLRQKIKYGDHSEEIAAIYEEVQVAYYEYFGQFTE